MGCAQEGKGSAVAKTEEEDDEHQNASNARKKEASIDCFLWFASENPNEKSERTYETAEEKRDVHDESAGAMSDSQINRRE